MLKIPRTVCSSSSSSTSVRKTRSMGAADNIAIPDINKHKIKQRQLPPTVCASMTWRHTCQCIRGQCDSGGWIRDRCRHTCQCIRGQCDSGGCIRDRCRHTCQCIHGQYQVRSHFQYHICSQSSIYETRPREWKWHPVKQSGPGVTSPAASETH